MVKVPFKSQQVPEKAVGESSTTKKNILKYFLPLVSWWKGGKATCTLPKQGLAQQQAQPMRCWGSHLSPVQSQAHIHGKFDCWRSCLWRSNSSTQSLNLGHAEEPRGRWQDESHCLWDLFSNSGKSHGICCGDSAAQNLLLKQEESSQLSTVQNNEAAATEPDTAPSG